MGSVPDNKFAINKFAGSRRIGGGEAWAVCGVEAVLVDGGASYHVGSCIRLGRSLLAALANHRGLSPATGSSCWCLSPNDHLAFRSVPSAIAWAAITGSGHTGAVPKHQFWDIARNEIYNSIAVNLRYADNAGKLGCSSSKYEF